VQRALGPHRRRLHRLINSLEASLAGGNAAVSVADRYAARLLDIAGWSAALLRMARS
jgi:hypothetical protein